MPATLDTLIVVKSSTVFQAETLTDLANPAIVGGSGLPTTSWQAGSVPRTLVAAQAKVNADFHTSVRGIANGGFLSSATGAWLTLLAYEFYGITRDAAVATVGIATLTDVSGGPHIIAVNDLIAQDSAGHQYRNITGGTLALGGALALRWQATETGALWNIGNGSLNVLVTALATVTINNPATWMTLPGTVASATQGTIRITDGAATGPHVVGAGTVTVSNGVQTYTNTNAFTITTAGGYADVLFTATAVGLAYNVANATITTMVVTPVAGLTTNNPGTTWITTAGSDEQTDADLREECRDQWSTVGVGWTSSAIEYLAKQAATSTPVTRVAVVTNPGGVAGLIGVTVGSVVGAMSAGDVAIVQAYFAADRITLTSSLTVSSCANVEIALTGTVRVPAAYVTAATTAATNNLNRLAQNTPVGGDDNKSNSVIWEEIIAAVMNQGFDSSGNQTNAGAPYDVDISAVTVGGVPGTVGADIALTSAQVPTFDITALTFTAV